VEVSLKGAVLCGYTGRDQEAVRRHIEELQREGVPPPASVPALYPKRGQDIATGGEICVVGAETSGEVEFVLMRVAGEILVGVGSDHTDRELERLDIPKSKQVCSCVLSTTLWRYEDLKEHWDDLEMRSWVWSDGERVSYQDSKVSALLQPQALVDLVGQRVTGGMEGLLIFSGTTPILTERMVYSHRFAAELVDPKWKRTLGIDYVVRRLDWFSE
jgi:hypothetical protein